MPSLVCPRGGGISNCSNLAFESSEGVRLDALGLRFAGRAAGVFDAGVVVTVSLAVVFRGGVFFATVVATVSAAGALSAAVFFAGAFLAGVVRAGVFFAGVCLAGVCLAGVFFAGGVLAGVFLAGVFSAGVFLAGGVAVELVFFDAAMCGPPEM